MQNKILELYARSHMVFDLIKDEQGQDLVEYAAVIVLVALALGGGMQTLAAQINAAMTTVGSDISNIFA